MLNQLFGPSIRLIVLDHFIEHPDAFINLRETARNVDKNPGSVSRVLPRLVEMGLLQQVKVGKVMYAYRLNTDCPIATLITEFVKKLKTLNMSEWQ